MNATFCAFCKSHGYGPCTGGGISLTNSSYLEEMSSGIEFSQTRQETMRPSENEDPCLALEEGGSGCIQEQPKKVISVLNSTDPPTLWQEITETVRENLNIHGSRRSSISRNVCMVLQGFFPILRWGRSYTLAMFRCDFMAGLTLASLGIPQGIGYAGLAKLDPQYGLYSGVVPPLIYAVMGSSREIAVGPVAVVSLLVASMTQKIVDPTVDPLGYRKLVFTATFFAGLFQAAFGLLRLGFLVDFLSHAALTGFMAGAAIVIGLQQLKGLLGISHFTNKTDVLSVIMAVWKALHEPWHPYNFLLGCSFLIFILLCRFIARKNKKLFLLPAIAPLVSVLLSTFLVYITRADNNGVKIIMDVKGGLNPSSVKDLQFRGPFVGEAAKIGLIVAVIALTEAIAVGRSFASINGYYIDGNKEMLAMGVMNLAGSMSSCYVATGSFSRTAVNFSAGCKTTVSNIVMAITVLMALELLTKFLYYTPTAILASIILSALPGLIDVGEAFSLWKVDKLDFLTCMGAFLGVLFGSVEIGLLVAVCISFTKILLNSIRPRVEILGNVPGADIFCSIRQYPMVARIPSVLIIRIDSSMVCFVNSNFIRERIMRWVEEEFEMTVKEPGFKLKAVILDMSNVMNIDTSGISALEELHKNLTLQGLQMEIVNPGWQVVHKLKLAKFIDRLRQRFYLTVGEAVDACLALKNCDSGFQC